MRFAIVGVSLRLPDADNLGAFWQRLMSATPAYRAITPAEAESDGVPWSTFDHPRHVNVVAPLPDLDAFPTRHFGIVRGEAELMDPQHRMMLVLAAEALQTHGRGVSDAVTGVAASVTSSTYAESRVRAHREWSAITPDYPSMLGNEKDFAATRIAYRLDLRGPAMCVQTACSSSLVAVHQAAMHLAVGDADRMIVTAASATVPQFGGYRYQEGGVLSPTGTCRPFSLDADGTINGNGGGAIVLRRYDDALEDGDDIIAVLEGTAVNNDGSEKVGFTAPSAYGQRAVIESALRASGLASSDIGFVECHGTGTPLGDPIEIRALTRAHAVDQLGRCPIGSLKAVYGHLDAAAGLVALIKVSMLVKTGTIPPQPELPSLSPALGLDRSRFYVPFTCESMSAPAAAVSSFGMGGTNAHAIVTGPPQRHTGSATPAGTPVLITVSADDEQSLRTTLRRLADYLDVVTELDLDDVAATLRTRRAGGLSWTFMAPSIGHLGVAARSASSGPGSDFTPTIRVATSDANSRAGEHVYLPPTALPCEVITLPPAPISGVDSAEVTTTGAIDPGFVRAQFARVLGRDDLSDDADFFELGGESLHIVDVVAAVEARFGCSVDFSKLDSATRVSTLVDRIASTPGAAPQEPVAEEGFLELGDGEETIYLFPPGGRD